MPPLHPIMIHFPIALFMAFSLFDIILFFSLLFNRTKRRSFMHREGKLSPASEIILLLSVIGAWTAVITGLWLKSARAAFLPHHLVNLHETLAITFSVCITLLAVYRFRRYWRPNIGYMFFLFVCIALLFATGHTGGSMVWQGASTFSNPPSTSHRQVKKSKTTKTKKQPQSNANQQQQGNAGTSQSKTQSKKKSKTPSSNQREYTLGRKVFRQSCSRCHGLNLATSRAGVYTTQQWQSVVQRMQSYANGSIPDTKAIVYYLSHLKQHG